MTIALLYLEAIDMLPQMLSPGGARLDNEDFGHFRKAVIKSPPDLFGPKTRLVILEPKPPGAFRIAKHFTEQPATILLVCSSAHVVAYFTMVSGTFNWIYEVCELG